MKTNLSNKRRKQWLKFLILSLSFILVKNIQAASPVIAPTTLPTAGTIASGNAAISATGSTLNINQSSQQAIINWQTFNVGTDSVVNFNQPNANASTLNRVLDVNPSQIFGQIHAPGEVILINAAGIYFSPTATVDVGSFTASSGNITDANYLSGNKTFTRDNSIGSIVNDGSIQSGLGGYIALLAPEVQNNGVVVANMGTVVMVSGEMVTLNFDLNNQLTNITTTPSTINTLIENKNAVIAPNGQIILSANAATNLIQGVVNQSGTLDASSTNGSISNVGGRILLTANSVNTNVNSQTLANGKSGGDITIVSNLGGVNVSGLVEANGSSDIGGKIKISGLEATNLSGATINANGFSQGGNILVGNDGKNQTIPFSVITTIDALTSLNAKGLNLLSNLGGFIETSGHTLNTLGQINTGHGGTWLIDPYDYVIGPSEALIINGTLTNGGNVYIQSGYTLAYADGTPVAVGTSGSGNITINSYIGPRPGYYNGSLIISGNTFGAPANTVTINANINVKDLYISARSIVLNTPSITSYGNQIYDGPVTLTQNITLAITCSGMMCPDNHIIFNSTLNGNYDLNILEDSLSTVFIGMVGGINPLKSLTVNSSGIGGVVVRNGVTTSSAQTYNTTFSPSSNSSSSVILSAGSAISFQSLLIDNNTAFGILPNHAISYPSINLSLLNFQLNPGASFLNTLNSIYVSGNSILGSRLTSTGSQNYNGAVMLTATTVLTGNTITFNGAVDSAPSGALLLINDAGTTAFNSAIGSIYSLSNLHVLSNSIAMNGGIIHTTGEQIYTGALTLGANTTFTGNNITFNNSVAGAYTVTLNDASTTTFNGAVSLGELNIINSAGININGGSISTLATQTYGAAVNLGSNTTLTGSNINFNGVLDGAYGLTINGNATSYSVIGNENSLTSLAINGKLTAYADIKTNGFQSYGSYNNDGIYNSALILGSNITLTSNNAPINFSGIITTLDSHTPRDLTINAGTGLTTFINGGVGYASGLVPNGDASLNSTIAVYNPINNLIINGTSDIKANIYTIGKQTYNGAVLLGSNLLTSTTGDITFNSTLNDTSGSYVNTTNIVANLGTVFFNDTVGGVNPFGAFSVGGIIQIGADINSNSQNYGGAVILSHSTILTGNSITFQSTIDRPYSLSIFDTARTDFYGAIGSIAPLASLNVTSSEILMYPNDGKGIGLVKTTGPQYYNSSTQDHQVQMNLNNLPSTFIGKDITFNIYIEGGSLQIVDAGTTTFNYSLGSNTPLVSLDISSVAIHMNGAGVLTSGYQNYTGPVTLGASNSLVASGITFNGSVDGKYDLNIFDSGTTTFNALVGSITPLNSLTTASNIVSINGGGITVQNYMNFNWIGWPGSPSGTINQVLLGADTVLRTLTPIAPAYDFSWENTGITFLTYLDGAHNLTINDASTTRFNGPIGSVDPLASLTVNSQLIAFTWLDYKGVSTIGSQTYNGPTITEVDANFSGNNITFNGAIDSHGGGAYAINISDTGNTLLNGSIGSTQPISSLTTNNSNSGTTVTLFGNITTSSDQTYNGDVIIAADISLLSRDPSITFNGNINSSPTNRYSLSITAADPQGISAPTLTFNGNIGSTNPLNNFSAVANGSNSFGNITTNGNISTFGDQTLASNELNINGSPTFTSANGTISFALSGLENGAPGTINSNGGTINFNVSSPSQVSTTTIAAVGAVGRGYNISNPYAQTNLNSGTYLNSINTLQSNLMTNGLTQNMGEGVVDVSVTLTDEKKKCKIDDNGNCI